MCKVRAEGLHFTIHDKEPKRMIEVPLKLVNIQLRVYTMYIVQVVAQNVSCIRRDFRWLVWYRVEHF